MGSIETRARLFAQEIEGPDVEKGEAERVALRKRSVTTKLTAVKETNEKPA